MKTIHTLLAIASLCIFVACKSDKDAQKQAEAVVDTMPVVQTVPAESDESYDENEGDDEGEDESADSVKEDPRVIVEPWKQQTTYLSPHAKEVLMAVRVQVTPEGNRFFFLGSIPTRTSSGANPMVYFYEYTGKGNPYIFDSMPAPTIPAEESIDDSKSRLRDYALHHFDNLWITGTQVRYFRLDTGVAARGEALHYFAYDIGTHNPPQAIPANVFRQGNPRQRFDKTALLVEQSPDKSLCLVNADYGLYVVHDCDPTYLTTHYYPKVDSSIGDVNLRSLLPRQDDGCGPDAFLIGAAQWSANGQTIFFDNSGVCMACIWKLDLATKKITKIVPEHNALSPWFFQVGKQQFIAYTQNNAIKIATAP